MDTFPPGFASYRKAFPELVIPMDPAAGQADGSSDTTAEASASSLDMEKRHLRPGSLSTDSSDSCGEGMIVSPTDISSTPMTRQNCAGATSAHSAKVLSADQRASFFSPAIPTKKNLPHNISPALSENSTPSHCNCKKSKCLKL